MILTTFICEEKVEIVNDFCCVNQRSEQIC